jgi:hypothetical protein
MTSAPRPRIAHLFGFVKRAPVRVNPNDAVLPFPLRQALDRTDAQLDLLIYEAFPLQKAG